MVTLPPAAEAYKNKQILVWAFMPPRAVLTDNKLAWEHNYHHNVCNLVRDKQLNNEATHMCQKLQYL